MRVLVIHNRYRSAQPSGENAVVDDETALLAQHGCEVERLELDSDAIASWPLRKQATLPGRVVWSSEGYRLTRRAIARFRSDVVHFHNTFPLFSPSALWAARQSGVAVVQTLHNFRPLCPAATFLRDGRVCEDCLGRLPLPAVRHGCYRGSRAATVPLAAMGAVHRLLGTWRRCVDLFIAPSEFTRSKYIEAGWSLEKLVVKHNTAPEAGTLRSDRPDGFLCVSRLSPEKGVECLLDAWKLAFPHGEQTLTIAGSGVSESALRSKAEGLAGVTFRGQVSRDEVMRLLARTRALIVPSLWYEGFPRVIAEALSVGVPVIVSRIGALAEIVDDGRTGLLVEPGSRDDLARALAKLASSDALAVELCRGARRAFDDRFGPVATTTRLVSLYERTASQVAQP